MRQLRLGCGFTPPQLLLRPKHLQCNRYCVAAQSSYRYRPIFTKRHCPYCSPQCFRLSKRPQLLPHRVTFATTGGVGAVVIEAVKMPDAHAS